MTETSTRALAIARPAIRILMGLNVFYAIAIAGALAISFFIDGWPARPFGAEYVAAHPSVGTGLRAIVVLAIVGAGIVHTILARILAIVDTVRVGDPFILENAHRLQSIAWRVMSLEFLRIAIAAIARATWEPDKVAAISIASWVAILLLFVLAGVFAHGARMRDDLAGTV